MILPQDRNLILLGPQPQYQSLRTVLTRIGWPQRVALITAGWETEEDQDSEIRDAVGAEVINLKLFDRTEGLFRDDPELIQQLQHRQDELRLLRDVYNERLRQQSKAARRVLRNPEARIDLSEERESAIAMIRELDQQHFNHSARIIARYEAQLKTASRHHVARHRNELAAILQQCNGLLISGGHVAIILNRLQIFGILDFTPPIPVIAWSGGAMALAERIVFFHDSLPQSFNDAEVLRPGLGVFQKVLPLPDARTRLNLNDRIRVELFARRFSQFQSIVFDEHTILERHERKWYDRTAGQASRLDPAGSLAGCRL